MNGCNNNNNKINQVREKAKFYLKSNFPSKLNLSFYCTSILLLAIIHFAHPCSCVEDITFYFCNTGAHKIYSGLVCCYINLVK